MRRNFKSKVFSVTSLFYVLIGYLSFNVVLFTQSSSQYLTFGLLNISANHYFSLILKHNLSLSFSEFTKLSPDQFQYGNNPYKGIAISPYNRFGNDFYSFLRALQYCELFGWEYLYTTDQILLLNHNFQIGNVKVITNPSDVPPEISPHLLSGTFFYPLEHYKIDLDLRYAEELKEHVAMGIDPMNLSETDLILHIRSGDCFQPTYWQSSYYAQPPLQFYLDIINSRNWSSVRIIAEDLGNPMIGRLMEMGYPYEPNSFQHDISVLLQAQSLAIGQGTIGIAAALLSTKLKNLYTFNQESGKMITHWNCQPDQAYQKVFFNLPDRDIPIERKDEMMHVFNTSKCEWSSIRQYSNTKYVWPDGEG